ncbi:MAG: protein NO VEIN domain-containing protein, partial [Candidatus Binatia bacterium]
GRIHRYGQEKDCLIFNFVTTNTREGRVLQKLFERIEQIEADLDPKKTGKVFNVLGDIFPANQLERMLRDMYAHNNMTEELIKQRIVEQVDTEHFRDITNSTLEGLAKRELNLSVIVGKSAEAKERRLVPEVVEDFFLNAAPIAGVHISETAKGQHLYRVGRVPRNLWPIGERLEPRFGKLGREYKQVVFDKRLLLTDATAEWVTPGHPLFEVVREDAQERVRDDLHRGAVFFDLHCQEPSRINIYSAAIHDGHGHVLHRRLFGVQENADGSMTLRQPTLLLDLAPAPPGTAAPDGPLNDQGALENYLVGEALEGFLKDVTAERAKEIETIYRHMEISLNELIHRQNLRLAELVSQREGGDSNPSIPGNIKQAEDRLDELIGRLERRRQELQQERHCTISEIQRHGCAWILPHPERAKPDFARLVTDDATERMAVDTVIAYERGRGWEAVSVENENRGFDLISRRPHPEDPQTAIEVRFIEVKGRAAVGEVALTTNEYKTAQRLKKDYWLYIVFNCASKPELNVIQHPAELDWKPIVKIEHYRLNMNSLRAALKGAV